jgi:hypothetical protein
LQGRRPPRLRHPAHREYTLLPWTCLPSPSPLHPPVLFAPSLTACIMDAFHSGKKPMLNLLPTWFANC